MYLYNICHFTLHHCSFLFYLILAFYKTTIQIFYLLLKNISCFEILKQTYIQKILYVVFFYKIMMFISIQYLQNRNLTFFLFCMKLLCSILFNKSFSLSLYKKEDNVQNSDKWSHQFSENTYMVRLLIPICIFENFTLNYYKILFKVPHYLSYFLITLLMIKN